MCTYPPSFDCLELTTFSASVEQDKTNPKEHWGTPCRFPSPLKLPPSPRPSRLSYRTVTRPGHFLHARDIASIQVGKTDECPAVTALTSRWRWQKTYTCTRAPHPVCSCEGEARRATAGHSPAGKGPNPTPSGETFAGGGRAKGPAAGGLVGRGAGCPGG